MIDLHHSTAPCRVQGKEATSINLKVIGSTRPAFELTTFGFSDLPEPEKDALFIRPSGYLTDLSLRYIELEIFVFWLDIFNMYS